VLALLLLPAAAFASAQPEQGMSARRSVEEVESIVLSETGAPLELESIQLDGPWASPILVAPDGVAHRGGVMTDGGLGSPASRLTVSERGKLEMARAAIEASRAAGTLYVAQLPEDTVPATPEELAAMKMQQLAARRSAAPAPDPIAGVGESFEPVQEVGPAGLSDAEQAKLRGETPIARQGSTPADASKAPISPEGDGVPVYAKEADSHE
jgi:hypothetical protein